MSFKVGIIGGAGYTAGELLRILVNHPEVEITWVQSSSHAGSAIGAVHSGLDGDLSLAFCLDVRPGDADIVFLCKGHGESVKIMAENPELYNTRVIDLSQDFRLKGDHQFVYGLPELYKAEISQADFCANPGCFATCIQLGLLPAIDFLSKEKINIHTSGITGSTGAGQKLAETSHFSWRTHNASVYKPITHQHLKEVGEHSLEKANGEVQIDFIPYRGAFARGIITTSCIEIDHTEEEVYQLYKEYYADAAFTHVVERNPDIKHVVNTNKCLVCPKVIEGRLVVVSVIDNLLKGASGQAVQNMNLMLELDESTGLKLKASAF
jgi:N-acetyl-gamma-glutamyl-phosphate reductase